MYDETLIDLLIIALVLCFFGGKKRGQSKWFVAMVSGRLGRWVTVVIGGICWGYWLGL
jgi:hypothetical protein